MNWAYSDALTTADRHAFFKYMVKPWPKPKACAQPSCQPFASLSGNGCHVHVSVWDIAKDENLFRDRSGELGLSRLAYEFMAGCSITPRRYAPSRIHRQFVQAHQRRAHPVGRDLVAKYDQLRGQQPHTHDPHPDVDRFELRLPDGSTIRICSKPR